MTSPKRMAWMPKGKSSVKDDEPHQDQSEDEDVMVAQETEEDVPPVSKASEPVVPPKRKVCRYTVIEDFGPKVFRATTVRYRKGRVVSDQSHDVQMLKTLGVKLEEVKEG